MLLLWLIYISGINGYMLPWDRLAQFVVVGTAEWLDWLPIFNGALVRNFIYQGSVNDRLFSLLSFIHIGVPLTLLLLLWIHIQRVPRRVDQPPRAIIALAARHADRAVARAARVVVTGRRRIWASCRHDLRFDWFFLPVFPLIYAWSAGPACGRCLLAPTLLLVLLPWLPPRGRRKDYRMTVHPGNRIDPGTPRRNHPRGRAARGHRVALRVPQRRLRRVQGHDPTGRGATRPYQKSLLTEDERTLGRALLCCARPLTDVEVEYEQAGAEAASAASRRWRTRRRPCERAPPT